MRSARSEHGFTLIEVVVSIGLAIVVLGATLSAFDVFQTTNRFDLLRNETQDDARNSIDRLARDFRNVAAPKSEKEVPGALEQAGKYSLTFQMIDPLSQSKKGANETGAMRVRYCLNNSNPTNEVLWRQELRWESATGPLLATPNGCPDTANTWERNARLVEHITNRIGGRGKATEPKYWLFTYGPSGWSEVAQIVSVEPTIYLNVNPNQKRPGETRLTSLISLRNANRSPIAAFTATQVALHVKLDASESTDPDGLALTYSWSEGAVEGEKKLPTTSEQYETGAYEAGTTHTFWLKVTDPGGLTATAKKTIKIEKTS
jgi:hypothetical protein